VLDSAIVWASLAFSMAFIKFFLDLNTLALIKSFSIFAKSSAVFVYCSLLSFFLKISIALIFVL